MSNTTIIEKIYAGLAKGDNQPIWDALSRDVEWVEAENIPFSPGEPLVGRDEIQKAVFDNLAALFDDFHINVARVVTGGDTVLVEGRYVGTTKTGNALDSIFAHVWDFDGDTIVRFQQYSDTWQWRRVLGVQG